MRYDEDGRNGRVFARGLRNAVGIALNPATGQIWVSQNERDNIAPDHQNLPPEEINILRDGGDYGWPYCYSLHGAAVPNPEYHDGARCSGTIPAALEMQAHSAPLGITFLHDATSFPEEYRGDLLVAFHGSWNRDEPTGAKVVRVHIVNGQPVSAQESSHGRNGLDVTNYALTLDLPDTGATIRGRAVLTIARSSHADTLRLDLIALHVDSVLVNDRATTFVRDDTSIRIPLPAGGNDTLAVAVRYAGAPSDGLIIRTDSTGRWTAFGDNWPQRARYWIPSIDEPGDKATVTWTVVAPSNRRVVANGELLEETPLTDSAAPVAMAGGMTATTERAPRTLTRWRESRPIPPYLMVIAAAPLAYYDLGRSACGRSDFGGCVRQSVYVLPEDLPFLPGPFAQADDIVNWFSRLVAPFPYEKLAHLQSLTRFGGMENATAIFYNNESFRRRTLSVGTVAHETAHQWFGDAVTEETFADLWLSEGFATYWAMLWTQHAQGDSAFRAGMAAMRREIIASPVTAARAVRDTVETDYLKLLNSNSYQKGGWVLHMLRTELGDSAFFRGVRA